MIAGALAAGAAAAGKDVAGQAIKDGYAAFKRMVLFRFGTKADVANAVQQVEQKPDSDGRRAMLKEQLEAAGAQQDAELVQKAQVLLDLLKKQGMLDGAKYQAYLSGSGAVAAGQGGVAVGGNISPGGQRNAK